MRTRFLKQTFSLVIGQSIIPVLRDLELLIKTVPRGIHGLSMTDLDPTDKMNAAKAIKISQERVENALKSMS